MISSFSNWIALVSMATCAAKRLKPSGRRGEYQMVRFGSGAGPRLYRVCSIRKLVLVTSERPSSPIPPIDSVTQVGSPENSSSYSGVRRNRTIRSLITKSSMISCACSSVIRPAAGRARSRRRGRSRSARATSPRRSAPSQRRGSRSRATAPPRARCGGAGDVVPVALRHRLQLLKRPDLLRELLAVPDHVFGGRLASSVAFSRFFSAISRRRRTEPPAGSRR